MTVLWEQDIHLEQIIQLADLMQQRLDDYAAHADDYHDDTYREPDKEDRVLYHDFYYAQACAFKAIAYANEGNLSAARREVDAYSEYPYGQSLDGRLMIAPALSRLGDYATMLATYDEAERRLLSEGDTVNRRLIEILHGRAKAAYAQASANSQSSIANDQYKLACDYLSRYERLKSKLNDRLQCSKAHLYAARYHTIELETALHQARMTHIKTLLINVVIGMVLFVVVAAAIYLYRQRRLLSEKNRILVQKIEDAQEYKRLYHSLKAQRNGNPAKTDDDSTEPSLLEAMTDAELFNYISDVVSREQLFLNPVCDRQMLVERFQLTEKRIGAAFSKGSSYGSVSNFVRNARLDYACQLLRQSPNMPIADVATAAGFPSYPRFAADFKATYSISPTEFRQQAKT